MHGALTNTEVTFETRPPAKAKEKRVDAYFSADVETDGPIPGPYSMLSFALVYAGRFDGKTFERPGEYDNIFYAELKPISDEFEPEALRVNGLDREKLRREGQAPESAMSAAARWVESFSGRDRPVLVAYPLSFDWSWLYWYFVRFSEAGSPFNHSSCYDIKTAFAVKCNRPVSQSGRNHLLAELKPAQRHTHHALDDAIEQAEIFRRVFEWGGKNGRGSEYPAGEEP
jgi:DNA polymerase III epsilon subunit-like protein